MLILGHPLIPSPNFVFIKNIDDIRSTTNNDIVYFSASKENLELAKYCSENGVNFAVCFSSYLLSHLELKDYNLIQQLHSKLTSKENITPEYMAKLLGKFYRISIDTIRFYTTNYYKASGGHCYQRDLKRLLKGSVTIEQIYDQYRQRNKAYRCNLGSIERGFFLFSNFKPIYIIFDEEYNGPKLVANIAQSYANDYLLDSKILGAIDLNDNQEWEAYAKAKVDGVISVSIIDSIKNKVVSQRENMDTKMIDQFQEIKHIFDKLGKPKPLVTA